MKPIPSAAFPARFQTWYNGARAFLGNRSQLLLVLATIVVAALLPAQPDGHLIAFQWSDQQLFIETLNALMRGEAAPAIDRGDVLPGYMALGMLMQRLFALDAYTSLVLLNRFAFLASCGLIAIFAARQIRNGRRPLIYAAAAVVMTAPIFTNFHFFSNIPWTHFVATAVLIGFFLSLDHAFSGHRAGWFFAGLLFLLLLQVRTFEAIATGCAAIIAFGIWVLGNRGELVRQIKTHWIIVLCIATVGLLTVGFIGLMTGQFTPIAMYGGISASRFAFDLIPIKFMQLFVDSCYYTSCVASQPLVYADGAFEEIFHPEQGLRSWHLPLTLQAPLLIASIAGLISSAIMMGRRMHLLVRDPLLVMLVVTACGLILGYTASVLSGGPHLKHGFVRDFMAPTLLFLMALVRVWKHSGLSEAGVGARRQTGIVVGFAIFIGSLTTLISVRATTGLPTFPETHVARYQINESCTSTTCRYKLSSVNRQRQPLATHPLVQAIQFCGERVIRRQLVDINEFIATPKRCHSDGQSMDTELQIIPIASGTAATPSADDLGLRFPIGQGNRTMDR